MKERFTVYMDAALHRRVIAFCGKQHFSEWVELQAYEYLKPRMNDAEMIGDQLAEATRRVEELTGKLRAIREQREKMGL